MRWSWCGGFPAANVIGGGEELRGKERHRCMLRAAVIGLPLSAGAGGAGCGITLREAASVQQVLFVSECERQASYAHPAVVVLDWNGGTNAIYPHEPFAAIDLGLFETSDGATLADDAESFKEQVRLEVARIFCEWPETDVMVFDGADDPGAPDTVVSITGALQPNGGMDIGEAEYDPCDRQHDNVAVIFGERIRRLGTGYALEEWVRVFANVCAHEIGHTLGYGHVATEQLADYEPLPAVELMLSHHSMTEMRKPQRFVVSQTYCPEAGQLARNRVSTVMSCDLAGPRPLDDSHRVP